VVLLHELLNRHVLANLLCGDHDLDRWLYLDDLQIFQMMDVKMDDPLKVVYFYLPFFNSIAIYFSF